MLVPFLWATGDNEQLRYRILPLEHFSNVLVLYKRQDAGMPVDNLIVHAGSLHGTAKVRGHGRQGIGVWPVLMRDLGSCARHSKWLCHCRTTD